MSMEFLIFGALAVPLMGSVIFLTARKRLNNPGIINLILTLLTAALLFGAGIKAGGETARVSLSNVLLLGLNLRMDTLAFFFTTLFTAAASVVSIFSVQFLKNINSPGRFFMFMQLTLLGCLGVVLAADLVTLFLFFELMTFASYVLVIHRENEQALNAGYLYLLLGVVGGLALLTGIILVYYVAGNTDFLPLQAESNIIIAAAVCFLFGFGIKTGVVPLHIWMPKAYSVSPVPVNIISSALMIKTGAYGLLRVYSEVLFPFGGTANSSFMGWLLVGLGLGSMFVGAFLALRQTNMLKTLAYSSISQIGYVILGLGVALFVRGNVGLGVSGMLFHILNHSVFKGTLFLVAGVILAYAGTLDYKRLGGLARQSPLLTATFAFGALGIAGLPGLNGYASKTFLHHGIEALEHYNPGWVLWFGEKVFVVASAITICYFLKMFLNVFMGPVRGDAVIPRRLPRWYQVPLLIGSAAIAFVGLFPHFTTRQLIVPAMDTVGVGESALDYALSVNVWSGPDLLGMLKTIAVAAVIWLLVVKVRLDRLRFPDWFSIEKLFYRPIAQGFMMLCLGPGVFIDRKVNQVYHGTGDASMGICRYVGKVDHSINKIYASTGDMSLELCRYLGHVDGSINRLYYRVGNISVDVCNAIDAWDQALDSLYMSMGRRSEQFCVNLDRLDQDLDKLYSDLGLVSTRAIHRLNSMEQGLFDVSEYKKPPVKRQWWHSLQDQLANPQWELSNLNVESIFVAIAFVVVVVILLVYGTR
ncbi:MAG: NADH dehydrogenase [Firmicutes bacterium]|nr:NADH dehydrogenase [Bacillota bacterium]